MPPRDRGRKGSNVRFARRRRPLNSCSYTEYTGDKSTKTNRRPDGLPNVYILCRVRLDYVYSLAEGDCCTRGSMENMEDWRNFCGSLFLVLDVLILELCERN